LADIYNDYFDTRRDFGMPPLRSVPPANFHLTLVNPKTREGEVEKFLDGSSKYKSMDRI